MKNKKIFALYIIVFVLMVIGVAYTFFSYVSTGVNINQLIMGDIYLNYGDNIQGINILSPILENPYEARSRVDNTTVFTISGTNDTNKDIYYEIDLTEGEALGERTRLKANELRFDLYEVVDDVNVPLISNVSFDEFNNTKIWVDKIDKNIEYKKVYRLRMWIDNNINISDTDIDADYSIDDWNSAFGNVKIKVVGDFNEKKLPYAFMKDDAKKDIKSLVTSNVKYITFDKVALNTLENNFVNKIDLTKNALSSKVYAYIDENTLHIGSDVPIYLPIDASDMFSRLNIKGIGFDNLYTANTTNMNGMFNGCSSMSGIDLSNFDTSMVTNMSNMFNGCSSLTDISVLTLWNTSNVTSSANMFNGCTSLVGKMGTVYNTNHIDVSYAHIDTVDNPGYLGLYKELP